MADLYQRYRNEALRPAVAGDPPEVLAARAEAQKNLARIADYAQGQVERVRRRDVLDFVAEGQWHLRHGRWSEARTAFTEALERDPNAREARQGRLEAARRVSAPVRRQVHSIEMPAQPRPVCLPSDRKHST